MIRWQTRRGGIRPGWSAAAAAYALAVLALSLWQSPPPAVVRGQVFAHDGTPVFGATVLVRGLEGAAAGHVYAAETARDGRFEVVAAPGALEVEARRRGVSGSPQALALAEGEVAGVVLRLPTPRADAAALEVFSPERVFTTDEAPSIGIAGRTEARVGMVTLDRVDLERLVSERGAERWLAAWGSDLGERQLANLAPYLARERSFSIDVPPAPAGQGYFQRYVELPRQPAGAYLLNVTIGGRSRRLTFQVTDLGLVAKLDRAWLLAYCCDLRTGAPRPGAKVTLWDPDGAGALETRTADADGLAAFAAAYPGLDGFAVLATDGDQTALAQCSRWYGDDDRRVTHLYTDRPIYRPGHHVYLKGIVRDRTTTGYAVPASLDVKVEIRDGRDQLVAAPRTRTNAWGSFAVELDIPDESFTGEWQVWAVVGGSQAWFSFPVAAYLKPDYKVTASAPTGPLTPESALAVEVAADYYFGTPVGEGAVTWSVRRSPTWTTWQDESLGEPWMEGLYRAHEEQEHGYGTEVAEGKVRLDAGGRTSLELPLAELVPTIRALPERADDGQPVIPEETPPYRLETEVIVGDGTGRQERAVAGSTVLGNDYGVELSVADGWLGSDQPVELSVRVRDVAGRPAAGRRLTVQSYRTYWVWDRVEPDGSWSVRRIPDGPYAPPEIASHARRRQRTIVRRGADVELETGADGRAVATVLPPQPGNWTYAAILRDDSGRLAIDRTDCWVSDERGLIPGYRCETELDLALDRPRYRPGETARVRVESQRDSGFVLVTHEGARCGEPQVLALGEHTAAANLRLTDADVPNGYAAACLVADKTLHQAERHVPVDLHAKVLEVEVLTSTPRAAPGDQVTLAVVCRTPAGLPADAEVSLGVVDESIYAMRADHPENAVLAFHGWRSNGVGTFFSATPYYYTAGKDELGEVRRHFPDTAYWNSSLETGADGRVEVKLRLPDNLGRWRATAIAHDRATAIGFGTAGILVNKPLMVRLEAPRFLTVGDRATITAAVHNETGQRREVTVALDAPSLSLADPLEQRVRIASGERANVSWRSTCPTAADARVRVAVVSGEFRDAAERILTVNPLAMPQPLLARGVLAAGEPQRVELVIPARAVLEKTTLRIAVAPTLAGPVLRAVDSLIEYQYGCVEQTTSRFLGCLAAERAYRELGWRPEREASLAVAGQAVRRGVLRLASMQNADGAWGWWEAGTADEWMTAYALMGLVEARSAGYEVPARALDSGLDVLSRLVARGKPRGWSTTATRALSLHALALAGRPISEAAWDCVLHSKSEDLTAEAAAHAALAARAARRPELEARALRLCWKLLQHDVPERDEAADLAWSIRALCAAEGASPRVVRLVEALNGRFDGSGYRTTQDSCAAVLALCDVLARQGYAPPQGTLTAACNGQKLEPFGFDQMTSRGPGAVFRIEGTRLRAGAQQPLESETSGSSTAAIELSLEGRGKVPYIISATVPVAVDEMPAGPRDASLTVARRYERVSRASGGRLRLREVAGTVGRDDVLQVSLTLRPERDERYVVIAEPLPAGCEVMEPGDVRDREGDSPGWHGDWCARDVRDDHIAFFFDHVVAGKEYRVTYLLRAAHAGEYRALPTRAEPMYEPERFAVGAVAALEIR